MRVARVRADTEFVDHPVHTMGDGTTYKLPTHTGENPWKDIRDLEHARYFQGRDDVEFEWDPVGRIQAHGAEAAEAVADMSYQVMQKLVSRFDLDVKGNAPKDDMEEAILEHLEDLQHE